MIDFKKIIYAKLAIIQHNISKVARILLPLPFNDFIENYPEALNNYDHDAFPVICSDTSVRDTGYIYCVMYDST